MKRPVLLLLLTACSEGAPSPDDCRFHGISAPERTPITGVVAQKNIMRLRNGWRRYVMGYIQTSMMLVHWRTSQ